MTPLTVAASKIRRPGILGRLALLPTVALVVLVLMAAVSLIGPIVGVGDPNAIGGPRLAPPSAHALFGTDQLGRSLLPRVVEGIRATFLISFVAVVITSVISLAVGLAAGYLRGVAEEVAMRTADVFFAFPAILLAMLIASIIGSGTPTAVATVVIISFPLMVRVIRAETLELSSREFVRAAEVSGASRRRILRVHLLPNVAGPAIVQASYALSVAMIVESGLSFLGIGAQPPFASLGSLVQEGTLYMSIAPGTLLFPSIFLAIAILSVNVLADGLHDVVRTRASGVIE